MNDESILDVSSHFKSPLVIKSLRRSNIRKKIAKYLFEISPSYCYISETA